MNIISIGLRLLCLESSWIVWFYKGDNVAWIFFSTQSTVITPTVLVSYITDLFPCISGGWKSKNRFGFFWGLTPWLTDATFSCCVFTCSFLCRCTCLVSLDVLISSSDKKDASLIEILICLTWKGLIFYLIHHFKGPCPNTVKFWYSESLRLQNIHFGRAHFSP